MTKRPCYGTIGIMVKRTCTYAALFGATALIFMTPSLASANTDEGNRNNRPGVENRDGDDRRDNRNDRRNARRCSIDLDQNRRSLDIEANTSVRNGLAWYNVNFDTRNGRGDETVWVRLDRRGDVEGSVAIPRGADNVRVTLRVAGTGVSCSETLELTRRGR